MFEQLLSRLARLRMAGQLIAATTCAPRDDTTRTVLREGPMIEHLWAQGRRLQEGYNVLTKRFGLDVITECIGLPPRMVVVSRDEHGEESLLRKSPFQQESLLRGILFSENHNLCYNCVCADIDMTLEVCEVAMSMLADAVRAGNVRARLRGEPGCRA